MNQDQQNRAPAEVTRSEASGPCAEWLGFGQGMSASGYKRLFGPCRRSDRSTPESRPSSGNVCFAPDFVCFTPRCGPPGRCPRSSGFDPLRTFGEL